MAVIQPLENKYAVLQVMMNVGKTIQCRYNTLDVHRQPAKPIRTCGRCQIETGSGVTAGDPSGDLQTARKQTLEGSPRSRVSAVE